MNLTHLIKIWLLMAIVAFSANGAVKANVASGPQNLGLEVHQEKSIAKPLMRQGKLEVSTMVASDIFIEEDKETGLLYAKARYLDPDSGRFLSQDAWEGDNLIAPSSHKYLYAYQNPTVYVDLDGNEPIDVVEGFVESVVNVVAGGQISQMDQFALQIQKPELYKSLRGEGNAYTKKNIHKSYSIDLRNFSIDSKLHAGKSNLGEAASLATLGVPELGQMIGETVGAAGVSFSDEFTQESKNQAHKDIGKVLPNAVDAVATRGLPARAKPKSSLITENVGGLKPTQKNLSEAPNDGVTLTAKFKDGMNPKEFDRKVNRVRNKIEDGDAFTNIPHNVTNAERSALTRKYRKDTIKRINSSYKDNPQSRENALKRLRNSDIDHIQDLQAGGQNVRKNLKSLDSGVNQELGRQFSRQIPKDVKKPIIKIKVEGRPEP
jgi:RHS repeat-associated protein